MKTGGENTAHINSTKEKVKTFMLAQCFRKVAFAFSDAFCCDFAYITDICKTNLGKLERHYKDANLSRCKI